MKLFIVLLGMLVNYVSCNNENTVTETSFMFNFIKRFNKIEKKVERFNEMELKIEQLNEIQLKFKENEAKYISEIVLLKEENRVLKINVNAIEKKNHVLNSRVNVLEKESPITSNIHENERFEKTSFNSDSNGGTTTENNHATQTSPQSLEGANGNDLVKSASSKHSDKRTARLVLSDAEGPVAFCATFHARAEEKHLGTNQPITYDKLITNIGGGFHMAHGIFTAPQSGIYLLSSSVMSTTNNRVIAGIVINGVPVALMYANYAGENDQGSQTIIVQLHQGDDVAVEIVMVNDVSVWGEMFTSFSGYMLTQM